MDVFEAVKTMLAVRSFRGDTIPAETVKRIVEAARLTGSSRNTQQWNFVVVQDAHTLKALGKQASTGPYIANAPLAIAVVVPDSPVGYIDGTRAVQDMMLVAWDAGIGSNWVGNVNTAEIKQLLNVPQDRMILTVVPFGYPDQEIGQGKKDRKALGEVAHRNKMGQPFS
ncbi:MAG: nitroreductase family protein [Caldilineaceae bacterium]